MKFQTRRTICNDGGNVRFMPKRVYEPENLEQIQDIVRTAESEGVRVRAIGSLHSYSDAAKTRGFAIMPQKLDKILQLDETVLNDGVETDTLVHVQSGVRLRELNDWLADQNLALPNMGGYDEQTVAGATATSTHGSGIEFGPLTEMIQSVELVSDNGALYRIEPENGITNPAEFIQKFPDWHLVQNDDWFNAVIVGMGCMGIFYSLIIKVIPKYWLKEVRTLSTWKEVKAALQRSDVLRENRHWEVIFNPHKVKGENLCLITTRNPVQKPRKLPPDKKNRNFLPEFGASIPFIWRISGWIFKLFPKFSPKLVNSAIKGLEDDGYTNISYKVLNIGTANKVKALSSEIALPMKNNSYLDAVEKFLEMAAENASFRKFHTAPVSLRFVKASAAHLSPQQENTCMMEIIFLKDTPGAPEMLGEYEKELYADSGRPHMGQFNVLTPERIEEMYPRFHAWQHVNEQLNANGTFNNSFSDRVFGTEDHEFQSQELERV